MQAIIGTAVVCGIIAWLALFPLRVYLVRWGLVDIPNWRSSHVVPKPRGGGLAIVVVVLLGLPVYWIAAGGPEDTPVLLALVLGSLLIATTSFVDDMRGLPVVIRLSAHLAAACILIVGVGVWHTLEVPGLPSIHLGILALPVTLVWIVGLTNIFNFMDGIDGIAGGQASVFGIVLAMLGVLAGQPLFAWIGLILFTANLGFLAHNWSPSRIIMGDVGSTFLGFLFAGLIVAAAQRDQTLALASLLPLWPFIFDATLTFLRRLRRGDNVLAAHREHLYQRLVIKGNSHGRIALLFIMLASAGGIVAIVWYQDRGPFLFNVGAGLIALMAVVLVAVSAARGAPPQSAPMPKT